MGTVVITPAGFGAQPQTHFAKFLAAKMLLVATIYTILVFETLMN